MVYLPTLIQCIYSLVKIDRNFVNLKNFKHKWFGHYVIIYPMLIGQLKDIFFYKKDVTLNLNVIPIPVQLLSDIHIRVLRPTYAIDISYLLSTL